MSLKASGEPTDWQEIDRFDDGVGWIAYPDEAMQRASHAMATEDGVYVIDPVDVEGLDDLLAEFGEVAGVVILLDRHKRDCAEIANRHDVPVYVPDFMDDVEEDLDAPVERFRHELGDSGFAVHEVVNNRFWQEAALYNEDSGVLVVSEAVGTTDYFRTSTEELGVHPMLRLKPPKKLTRFDPDRIHLGHGAGIHEDAAGTLEDAISSARAHTPALVFKNVRAMLPV
jgi:hypothetical protein